MPRIVQSMHIEASGRGWNGATLLRVSHPRISIFIHAVSLPVSPPFLPSSNIVVPAGGVAYLPAADATPVI